MKSVLSCALGILALAIGTVPCRADHHAPCGNGRCCGQASIHAASCCDDPCCKPSFWDRCRGLFAKKNGCEPCCDNPCDHGCDSCYKPSLWGWFMSWKGKQACDCCPTDNGCDDCCPPKKKWFGGFFKKKKDCCDPCCDGHIHHGDHAPVPPKMEAEKIPAPLPKVEEKKEEKKE